jgi:hypothetical protein
LAKVDRQAVISKEVCYVVLSTLLFKTSLRRGCATTPSARESRSTYLHFFLRSPSPRSLASASSYAPKVRHPISFVLEYYFPFFVFLIASRVQTQLAREIFHFLIACIRLPPSSYHFPYADLAVSSPIFHLLGVWSCRIPAPPPRPHPVWRALRLHVSSLQRPLHRFTVQFLPNRLRPQRPAPGCGAATRRWLRFV